MVVLTYAFGRHSSVMVVEDWALAIRCLASISELQSISWIRIQVAQVVRREW